MAVAYVLYETTCYGIYISEYHGWFSLRPLYLSPTYARMPTAKYVSITRYLVRSFGLAMMSTFGESLALQETLKRYTQSDNQATKSAIRANDQTNTFNYNC